MRFTDGTEIGDQTAMEQVRWRPEARGVEQQSWRGGGRLCGDSPDKGTHEGYDEDLGSNGDGQDDAAM